MELALAQLAIQLLPLVKTGAVELIAYINSIRKTLQQTGEWPEATEAAFRVSLIATGHDPAYLQDNA